MLHRRALTIVGLLALTGAVVGCRVTITTGPADLSIGPVRATTPGTTTTIDIERPGPGEQLPKPGTGQPVTGPDGEKGEGWDTDGDGQIDVIRDSKGRYWKKKKQPKAANLANIGGVAQQSMDYTAEQFLAERGLDVRAGQTVDFKDILTVYTAGTTAGEVSSVTLDWSDSFAIGMPWDFGLSYEINTLASATDGATAQRFFVSGSTQRLLSWLSTTGMRRMNTTISGTLYSVEFSRTEGVARLYSNGQLHDTVVLLRAR